ncbi:hypothetical protein H0H81_002199 [Sphagnurus paluster]|uniref:Uncharacterized protein n=1 Tax=Sphagnurus paluster TaxID=117069 RepID=A0A9P7GLZ4_9AGAR|nr:hypothetical protein H0H81_002199 [Sphagnurus paluster]
MQQTKARVMQMHPCRLQAERPLKVAPHERTPSTRTPTPAATTMCPDKPRADPAYRTFVPIVDLLKSGTVFNRVLGSNVTMSVEELCSIAPEIRGKFRKAVTQKRVTTTVIEVELETVEEIHLPAYIKELEAVPILSSQVPSQAPRSNIAQDYYNIYLRSLALDETPEQLMVGKETRSLWSIFMNIDTMEQVKCIVDSGSQIVAMSEEVCHELKIKYDPSIILNMQSANGCLDPLLSLARNVPCTISDLTLYLQIHVICNPAYNILLGCPFDVLTSSNVKTYPDGNTVVTITDPNSGDVLAIPTFAHASTSSYLTLIPKSLQEAPTIFAIPSRAPRLAYPSTPTKTLDTPTSSLAALPTPQTLPIVEALAGQTTQLFNVHNIPHIMPRPPQQSDRCRPAHIPHPRTIFPLETAEAAGAETLVAKIKGVQTKKKYKPVAQKVRSVVASCPDDFRIEQKIIGDPLASMLKLDPNPAPFHPQGHYTEERMLQLDHEHPGFLTEAERRIMHDLMCKQNQAFIWEDEERGSFCSEFFLPVNIPVVEYMLWIKRNIPIPPGIYDEVCSIIRSKMAAGVYELSNLSYQSRWFCTMKKNGKLQIVHSLEPLNCVTIRHSGVTPLPDHIAEQFAGKICGAMLNLFVGYD